MKILGRSDRVDLPGLGLENIHAKIDTGAYTCSLHCSATGVVNGKLEFVLLDEEHPEYTGRKYTFKRFDQREIKNSFGEAELRYVIKTRIRILGHLIRAEFSLSNRGNLKFPVLLGRKILRKRFLIDVTKKIYLTWPNRKKVEFVNRHLTRTTTILLKDDTTSLKF